MPSTASVHVLFRVDASLAIGTGHVMRCLTLADALQGSGVLCRFVCREHRGNLIDRIREAGYEVHALSPSTQAQPRVTQERTKPVEYASWLGADSAADAEQTLAVACEGQPVDWLIVDHYGVNADWERRLRAAVGRVMVIDDLQNRPHECDLLLNQNLGFAASGYEGWVPAGCSVLLGPKYALLRPEFSALRAYSLERRGQPTLKHILIAMGGVDKDNLSGEALRALRSCSLPADCRVTVVMGANAPWLDSVRQAAAAMPRPTEVLVNVRDMARLMAESDLSIGAAGTMAWERCCLGLPALTVILAENQRPSATALQSAGAIELLDESSDMGIGLTMKLPTFGRSEALKEMARVSSTITDGTGATQVVKALTNG